MRIAVAKPDWGVQGGFEILLSYLVSHLTASGHDVAEVTVQGSAPDHFIGDSLISDAAWAKRPEAYTYESLLHRFGRVDTSNFDLVITTQPGSWAIDHPRKLALFYHHQRIFYDLAEQFSAVQGIDATAHLETCERIRYLDQKYAATITRFLVPSRTVADRLVQYWGTRSTNIDYFFAGPLSAVASATSSRDVDSATGEVPRSRPSEVVCVSRSEFSKRTELFVAAAHQGFDAPATLIGGGGQLPAVRRWAAEAAAGLPVHPRPWERRASHERVEVQVPRVPVDIVGRLSDDDLQTHYLRALCLVAPAYNEDYGLTALEAFTHGIPVVVCDDGGGLVEFVEDGINGLITKPEPAAIAKAVRSISSSKATATRLRQGALATAARYTWQHAHAQLDAAIDAVMETG